MATTRRDGKERDILLARDGARNAAEWLVEGYNSKSDEDFYPGTNIPLEVISEAAGADDFLQPRSIRIKNRNGASTSTVAPGARSRGIEETYDEEMELGSDEEISDSSDEDFPLDDSDIDGDALRDALLYIGDDDEDD